MNDDPRWTTLWNIGILVGLIGLPAELGFFAGRAIELSAAPEHAAVLPWRIVFVALGILVGALAAWRTLAPERSRRD